MAFTTNIFKAEIGHHFEMPCVDENGHTDVYRCRVLEIEPPARMVRSWVLAGNENKSLTEVELVLTTTDNGTKVTLQHRGDRDREMLERFKAGRTTWINWQRC